MSVLEHSYYGRRVEHTTKDGAHWREATPRDLSYILRNEPEHRVIVGQGEPSPASKYAGYYLPGDYSFLVGIAALFPVYVEVLCVVAE